MLLVKQQLHSFTALWSKFLNVLIYTHHLDHHYPLLAENHVVPHDQDDVQPGHEEHRGGEVYTCEKAAFWHLRNGLSTPGRSCCASYEAKLKGLAPRFPVQAGSTVLLKTMTIR